MSDTLTRLRETDPLATGGRDALDPAAPHAQALLARALATAPPPRTPARRPLRPLLGAAAAAAIAATALVLAGGAFDGTATPSASAAVVSAATALPQADSGLMVQTTRTTSDADGRLLFSAREQQGFAGTDVAARSVFRSFSESHDALVTQTPTSYRVVDDTLFIREDGGPWRRVDDADPLPSFADAARSGSSRDAAIALADALTGVTAADGPDGTTQYTGKITPGALQAAYGDANPYRVELLTAHADQLLDGIAVKLVVGADGALRTVSFTRRSAWTHPTLSSVTSVTTLDYSGLGTPQTIEAPAVG